MPATKTKRRTVTVHSTELATDVRRGIGWQAYCACGWDGAIRKTVTLARADAAEHRAGEHQRFHSQTEHPAK
jgi:hypothetical protein